MDLFRALSVLAVLVAVLLLPEHRLPGDRLPEDRTAGEEALPVCGIAAGYPGDARIGTHPAVLFHEDFEHGSMAVLRERFTDIRNPANIELVPEPNPVSAGSMAVRMRSVGGRDTGAHLYRQLAASHDRLFLRYYVRYRHGDRYHHTAGALGGYNPPSPWPRGGSGTRPAGDDRFMVRAEPVDDRYGIDLYTYWMEMRGNPAGPQFWGNTFLPGRRPTAPDREWVAVEVMVRMNDPVGSRNGELALWIDGDPVIHLRPGQPRGEWVWDDFHHRPVGSGFDGFRWRSDPDLALNVLWLLHYVTGHAEGEESFVWFDDVVLATEYVGPVGGGACP